MSVASGDIAGIITAVGGLVTVIGGFAVQIFMTLRQNRHLVAQDDKADAHNKAVIAELQKIGVSQTGINKVLHIDQNGP